MESLRDLKNFSEEFPVSGETMPILFVGHGNPMNALEKNEFSSRWGTLGRELPRPRAILCISAHWETHGTMVTAMKAPKTIHDFGGFPEQLYEVEYPAPGSPLLAEQTKEQIKKTIVALDSTWGLDHGCWSVVRRMYPDADIPVLQLSLDHFKSPQWHFDLAAELAPMRNKGILIIGSGNIVHNLPLVNWREPASAYEWALEANDVFKRRIVEGNFRDLINYSSLGTAVNKSVPTPEHFLPMLYILGLRNDKDGIEFFNDKTVMGSISMTSFKASC